MGWKYVSSEGRTYYVGLFHGEETGHLLIYCGSNIVHMDFSVLQASTFSFLIDDDLCEVVVEPAKKGFSYQFFANREKEAARQEERKVRDRKYLKQTIIFGLVFFGVIAIVGFFMVRQYRINIRAQRAAMAPLSAKMKTTGVVSVENQRGDTLVLYYRFSAQGQDFNNVSLLPSGKTPFGLPVETGDEFTVFYTDRQPVDNMLLWSMPSETQIERYRKKITIRHAMLNPELTTQQVACQVNIAYQLKELEGWADFYFQQATEAENPLNNNLTYKRLVRDVPFRQAMEKACW